MYPDITVDMAIRCCMVTGETTNEVIMHSEWSEAEAMEAFSTARKALDESLHAALAKVGCYVPHEARVQAVKEALYYVIFDTHLLEQAEVVTRLDAFHEVHDRVEYRGEMVCRRRQTLTNPATRASGAV